MKRCARELRDVTARKKRLSLDRDHVSPGEYPHAFRRQWPRKKAKINRAFRRKVREVLEAGADGPEAGSIRRKRARKWEIISLRESIKRKLQQRIAMFGAHKARRRPI